MWEDSLVEAEKKGQKPFTKMEQLDMQEVTKWSF